MTPIRFIPLKLSVVTLSGLVLTTTTLTGCDRFSSKKTTVNQPTPLVAFTQTSDGLSPLFAQSIGTNTQRSGKLNPFLQKKQTLTQKNSAFHIGFDAQGYVAAAPSGKVIATTLDGKPLWQANFNQGLSTGVTVDAQSNVVLVADRNGQLIALNRTTGQTLWQTPTQTTVLSPALISSNRAVVLGNNGVVSGFNLQNGQVIWQFATQQPAISVRGSASPILLNSNQVLVSTADGRIHALNLNDGEPLWSRRISQTQGASDIERLVDIDATPVFSDNILYVLTYSGQLVALDMSSRQLAFVKDYAGLSSVAVDDSQLFLTTLDGNVVALDKFTGRELWQSDSLRFRGITNPVVTPTRVLVGDALGFLHAFDKTNGNMVEREPTRQDIAYLRVANQRLLAQSQNGDFSVWQVSQ